MKTEFTKQDIEKIAYEIQENNKELSPDECWNQALNKVNWFYISQYKKLSEDFIREFKDKVDWVAFLFIKNYLKISSENLKIK
jgi:hypothetical protein